MTIDMFSPAPAEDAPLAVIACGSREWLDRRCVRHALRDAGPEIVIHGACSRKGRPDEYIGADAFAHDWATFTNRTPLPMPAQWTRDGNAAGPIRNGEMLKVLLALRQCGYRVEVHTFALPQSKGTRHMARIARKAGVTVVDHGEATT